MKQDEACSKHLEHTHVQETYSFSDKASMHIHTENVLPRQ